MVMVMVVVFAGCAVDQPGVEITRAYKTAVVAEGGSCPWYDIRDYGAVPNDTGDDGAAIQATIDALPATGGTIFLSQGAYRVDSAPLVLPVGKLIAGYITNIRIQGESSGLASGSTTNVFGTRVDFRGSGMLFDLYDSTTALTCINVQFRDFEVFDRNNSQPTYGIRANKFGYGCVIENVGFKAFYQSVAIETQAYYSKLDRVVSLGARNIGIKLTNPNMTDVFRCQASNGGGDGLYIAGNHGVLVSGGWYELNTGYGIHVVGANLHGVVITGNYLERNMLGGIYVTGTDANHFADGGLISGNYQPYNVGYGGSIILGRVRGYTVTGNNVGAYQNVNSNCIYSAYCENCLFNGNSYPAVRPTMPLNVPQSQNNIIIEPSLPLVDIVLP
jgi:hypothetical protein